MSGKKVNAKGFRKPSTMKKKANRIGKGQSSSSNPSQRKFRDEAKSKAFSFGAIPVKGPATLTVERLQKHNGSAQDLSQPVEDSLDQRSVGESESGGTVDSAWTLASVLTMNKLLTKWDPTSALHKEMLAMYNAVTEIIRARGGQETDTEYFAVLSSTLETVDTDVSRTSAAALLAIYANRVPPAVLRKKFSWITTMCMNMVEHYVTTVHVLLIRNLLSLIASCLKSLELAAWNESSTMQVLGFMLPFMIHSKPRLRKYAQQALHSVLSGSCVMSGPNAPTTHPAIPPITAFCIQVIRTSTATSVPISTLHVFGFLKMALPLSAQPEVKSVCESMLEVMGAGHPTVVRCGMQTLQSFFASKPSPSVTLGPELNAQLVNALYDYKPGVRDTKLIDVWLGMMQNALINLQSSSDELFLHNLPKFVGIAVDCWQHGKPEIYNTATCVSTTLLQKSLRVCLENEVDLTSRTSLCFIAGTKVVEHFERALHYSFASAWDQVLFAFATVFEVLGKRCPDALVEPLRMIAAMHGSQTFTNDAAVERAVGAAIKAMGPERVLKAYPLLMAGEEGSQDFSRSWMLPVLRENIKSTRLAFFTTYFLPLASAFHECAETAEKPSAISKSYELLEKQIWSLLPGFCTGPTDLKEAFPRIAKTLGNYLVNREDLRLDIMSALRHLINTCGENEGNVEELQKYSKNFLPILFNIYTTEATSSGGEGIRLAAYDTIKVFVGISDNQLCCALFFSASEKLLSGQLSAYTKQAILDLARALACKISAEHVERLYTLGKIHLEDPDRRVQKKAYRVVEEICKCLTPVCKKFVAETLPQLHEALLDSFQSVAPGSRAPRLRCFALVLENLGIEHKEFAMKVLREAVLCIKVNAAKVRQAAYDVVLCVGRALIRWQPEDSGAAVQELVSTLTAGLIGGPYVVSCTILALSTVLYEFKGSYSSEVLYNIMEAVQIVISSPNREIVQSALYFVRMLFVILSTEELSEHLGTLVPNLCCLSEDCQKHFRLKLRDIFVKLIRKFGYENIAALLPVSYRKMASNIRKIEERKKRKRERTRNLPSEDEDDEASSVAVARGATEGIEQILQDSSEDEWEDEGDEEPRRRKNRRAAPVWIEEQGEDDIVDFLDTSAGKQIIATNPKQAPKKKGKCPFEVTKDGRLLIVDPESTEKKDELSEAEEAASELLDAISHYKDRKRKAGRDVDAGEGTSKAASAAGPSKKRKVEKASDGDAKKGNLEPYAYLPLSRMSLNKRFKKKPQAFKKLLWAAQKGAKKGQKKAARKKKRV